MDMQQGIRLDLGCGRRKKDGFVGVDLVGWPGVDIICDLNNAIPLADDTVVEVFSNHVLEHLDVVKVMHELYRVCKNGAVVRLRVPYFKSTGAFSDPTHRSFLSETTWEYFDRSKTLGIYYSWEIDFRIEQIKYEYNGRIVNGLRFWPWLQRYLRGRLWDVVSSMTVELKVNKLPFYELRTYNNE